jgi:hypothetical protein
MADMLSMIAEELKSRRWRKEVFGEVSGVGKSETKLQI